MHKLTSIDNMDFDSIPYDYFWNTSSEKEQKMHRIHAYPAKFPAFITQKALNFAEQKGVQVSQIADVFCGCGTVAFEAKRNQIPFWGCDINPVATLIAKVKSSNYQEKLLNHYYQLILDDFNKMVGLKVNYKTNDRLLYWFDAEHYKKLFVLKLAIEKNISLKSSYRLFFLCAFSNILKSTSRWLTKSIKPQIDPVKVPADVISAFQEQCKFMMIANKENSIDNKTLSKIITGNFLKETIIPPEVDLLVTSPPYVTSYEYADLHQLSSLWLDYADDYRKFREGSIGSLHHVYDFDKELNGLNNSGKIIVSELLEKHKPKARSVAKYFLDMQSVTDKCYGMISNKGFALFVIGNTEYKGVKINNVKHLAESLRNSGFDDLYVTKRKVQQKILTPYRNALGRFSIDCNSRKVYNEEFILIGRK